MTTRLRVELQLDPLWSQFPNPLLTIRRNPRIQFNGGKATIQREKNGEKTMELEFGSFWKIVAVKWFEIMKTVKK